MGQLQMACTLIYKWRQLQYVVWNFDLPTSRKLSEDPSL